ncbi:hypothetical protein EJ077_22385 [Mesorhizobium sp. M8A.F.Ca.ET.057.01.1.1]|nr:hypothetical protein EJ077_22385 [Mesorhizobium sp. M8A.F.Ca.ET.057.01.1.1]
MDIEGLRSGIAIVIRNRYFDAVEVEVRRRVLRRGADFNTIQTEPAAIGAVADDFHTVDSIASYIVARARDSRPVKAADLDNIAGCHVKRHLVISRHAGIEVNQDGNFGRRHAARVALGCEFEIINTMTSRIVTIIDECEFYGLAGIV